VTAGVVFTDMVSGFFSQLIEPARTIDIGQYQSSVAGLVFAPLEMDAALDAVAGILTRRGITSPPATAAADEVSLEKPEAAESPARDRPLTQQMLWNRLCDALTPGNVVLADQGTSFYGMADHRLPQGVTFIGQPLWGSIGYTLPAALGAGLAEPDRRTVLLIGDGAAQLTIQELGTFSREGLSPVIVVVNNDGYTVERAIHGEAAPYNDIVSWSWTDIPNALGVANHLAFRAHTYGELDDALAAAAQHKDRMVLVEAVLPRLEIPRLLVELVQPTSPDGSARR
jgi:indolepyruvate decarboxylase